MHIASQLFPPFGSSGPLRFSRLECVKKIPSSPENALVYTVLTLSSEACGKSPCSSILFAAFSRPYNSPSEICQAYFCLGCFAHSKGDGASPQKPQLRSGLATNILLPRLLPIPCTYELYAHKNYRQDISHFIWSSLDEPLADAQKDRSLRQSFGKKFRNLLI